MKAALLIVLSLSALAYAGPAFNKNANTNQQVDSNKVQPQHDQYMTAGQDLKQSQGIEVLKQWCFSSQMSQPELTSSFKKLVGIVKSSPQDQSTEAAVMSERICQGAIVQKAQSGETVAQSNADAKAHELIKDVYMDALIACESRECMQQLVKIINSNKVDAIRASYYMTRIAVTEKASLKKDDSEAKQLAEDFISQRGQQTSEAVERQQLFAVTALLGKSLKTKVENKQQIAGDIKQTVEEVVKTIVERYIKPVTQQEVQQYLQQQPKEQSSQIAKKIAKRSAALKALANIPGFVLKDCQGVEEILLECAQNKQELSTVRQSAIECLEQNDSVLSMLKQITFDQQEPIEVRVAAYRTMMTVVYAGMKDEQTKQQTANEIVGQVVKHCEDQRNQQNDDQFVLFAISHLDNLRTSQQPEHQAFKECIAKNKQHYMQIQLLCKKLQWDIRKSSRNYKLEQEFNQIESGLIIEGDLIYESKQKQQNDVEILPKLVRVNMSMPVMGETVNVVEITLRQNQMDEELLGALKLVQGAKFNSESMSKVVDSFKSSVERSTNKNTNRQQVSAEADLSIKVDGCTIVYLCLDDFKSSTTETRQHQRNTRSVYNSYSIVDEVIEHLKRKPVAFNRGFNFNLNERLAKVLDVDANIIAGLRFDSRATGQSSKDFEIVAQMEPRFAFEAIVGPAKMTSKKLLQRFSTKTALGLRLKFKSDELVDVQIDLPMNVMELFTVETQLVEKSSKVPHSYTYLPESIYGQEDIYSPAEEQFRARSRSQMLDTSDEEEEQTYSKYANVRNMKRSIFEKKYSTGKSIMKFMQGKESSIAHTYETSEDWARTTGLRNKVRIVASPKDMSFLCQFLVEKYEPRMQGYRLQLQKVHRGQESKQYVIIVSTPGSRFDRTMQLRVVKQSNSQRTVIKSDIQSPKMSAAVQYELVHDGRQYAVKLDVASTRGAQWRHALECGFQRGSQSQSGRVATSYKPYLNIESTHLRRPVQLQGVVSYQQSPKTVISYELKSPISGDFVQGKWIMDQRPSSPYYGKRSMRSMQSPIEILFQNDLTWTGELVGQVREHTFKVHQMIDWVSSKFAMNSELLAVYKNQRKSVESQYSANLKLDKDQQVFIAQYKCPQQVHKEYRLTIASDCKSPNGHQFVVECRYNGKRGLDQILAYKHKIDFTQMSSKRADLGIVVELVDSSRQFNEKFVGRTQVGLERNMKSVVCELSSRNKNAKVNVEFVSLDQHLIEVVLQGERLSHRTQVRADRSQFAVQSRTEEQGQMLAKIVFELFKQQQGQCQLIVELPTKSTHVVFDLKPESGKLSSMAIQTPRFASKAEFVFDRLSRGNKSFWMKPLNTNYRFKTDLKDMMNKDAYWMESAWNGDLKKKSFFHMDSPIYRTDIEYEPRDQSAKWGMFARSSNKNSNYDQMYSTEDSILNEPFETDFATRLATKLPSNKLWMLRSMISSPSKMDELKQKARRALFEYADRRQTHKHSINWNPVDERVNFAFERQPLTTGSPMRLIGDLTTDLTDLTNTFSKNFVSKKNLFSGSKSYNVDRRPSTISMESDWTNLSMEALPFDGQDCYARVQALSRHRRSPYKKHESEIHYKKDQGYKAWMKHQDKEDKHHKMEIETDESPKKWAKLAYESDKHGKGKYEHKWRKYVNKRSSPHPYLEDKIIDQDMYANQIDFSTESPKNNWTHRTLFNWIEPVDFVGGRVRRDVSDLAQVASEAKRTSRYTTLDYLKHINARLSSQTALKNQAELYNVDFDYQPEKRAHLQVSMPNELLHSSSLEFEPTERLYKLQSRLINQRTKVPHYELQATTGKPIYGLATAEQEPVFIDEQHPMLDRPITNRMAFNILRQPLKLDYSDKYGRVARVDYDQSPILGDHYTGLRQKRAAVYYKDDSRDIEHDSSYHFYPEAVLGFNPSKRVPGDLSVKALTKYGPVKLHAESNANTVQLIVESPVVSVKLVGETSPKRSGSAQLYKLYLDNKQQRVQLAKIVRQTPVICDLEIVEELAQKLDQGRLEHETELLVNIVESIFKIKSQTLMNQRPVMFIEGEFNKPQEKAVVKINGKRTNGQLIVDLINNSANLVLDVDDKRTLSHQTRLVRINDKFYSLESVTSYKQQPLFKLNGKVSALIFSEPEHLFSRRSYSGRSIEDHISTFEAILYKPKPYQISGHFNCAQKEARVVFKNLQDKKIQETLVKYDQKTDSILVDARLSSPYGQVYTSQAKLSVLGLSSPSRCQRRSTSCNSEINYREKSGDWSAKYFPGQYISVDTPYGERRYNLY